MRRVIAISLAILVLAVGARGVMAQDSGQQVSDRLLEILKDRQIISEDEYSELKDLATEMEQQQGDMNARLDDIDRSISEYLAQGGDARGANVSHKKGDGFGFATGDGFFSMWLGGLFQTWYVGADNEYSRDTNSISVPEARIDISGNAFDPNLTYRFEVNLGSSPLTGGVLDLWGNWDLMNGAQIKFGQMKVPYGRQMMTYQGDLEFESRNNISNAFTPGWDLGVMVWDAVPMQEGGEPMFDYYAGLFNGDGRNVAGNDNNWMAVALRAEVHPLGYVPLSEGDFEQSKTKFAAGASYYYTNNRPGGQTVKSDNWNLDAVVLWNGLFFQWEYFYNNTNPDGANRLVNWGWYAQAGFMIPNSKFEVIGRYGFASWDQDTGLDETKDWAIGFAYYFDGHPFKIVVFFTQTDTDEQSMSRSSGPVYPEFDSYTVFVPGKTNVLSAGFQIDW